MNQLVLATRNRDKVKEIRHIMMNGHWEFLSLLDFPEMAEVAEDGKTLLDNALKKARAAYRWTKTASIADDTGLEVDQLNGDPGVRSSRFAGENVSYRDNNEKLLRLLQDVPREKRTARFRCIVVFADGRKEKWVEGICEGIVLSEYCGVGGFGYDPLFYVPEKGKTFAEMSREEKNAISHRGKAFRLMGEWLKNVLD
ncbi:XTP/dITP diphosphatase [bacterium]|nr:XTP/dITP diphosphatase [bacterium]